MTVLKSRNQTGCGYALFARARRSQVADNIRKIRFRNDASIKTIKVEDFDKEAIAVPSAYNPPKIKTLLTSTNSGYTLVANLEINGKKVQFICVDGSRLTDYQFQDPDTVIDLVNSGRLPPVTFRDLQSLTSNQMTMVDAYAGSIWYCLFLWEIFGRVAIIDDSQVFLSVVNVNMANAFWNSHYMTYGNGNEPGAPKMGALTSIDVVGHESGHGIIEALGNLTYQGESGALNESIADIFGTCLEKYYDLRSQSNLFDWDLGEDFMVGGMRSLSNPKSHDQPDTYRGRNWADPYGEFDNGGVHINSGVNNYFFYSVASGASGKNDNGTEYRVAKTMEIFHLAKFIYLSLKGAPGYKKITSDVNYSQYSECLLANCTYYLESNNLDKDLRDSVIEGLVAVGLRNRNSQPPGDDLPPPPSDDDFPTPPPPPGDDLPPPPPPGDDFPREIVWSSNFDASCPFYTYGLSYPTNSGRLVFAESESVAAFDLSGLREPILHIDANLGSNNLSVQFNVGGKVYQHLVTSSGSSMVMVPVGSDVVISLKPISDSWIPGWSHLYRVAFSSV